MHMGMGEVGIKPMISNLFFRFLFPLTEWFDFSFGCTHGERKRDGFSLSQGLDSPGTYGVLTDESLL